MRDRPQLDLRQGYFHKVFLELSGSRDYSSGGTPLEIPISEIKSYCEMFYITSLTEREQIVMMVQALDKAYVKLVSDKIASERSDNKT